jgi:uncharacterized repeat protein (TIGR01451 family)
MNAMKAMGRLGLGIAALASILSGAQAYTAAVNGVSVIPLARSAGFEFRLDEIAPTLYSKSNPGPWMESGRRAMLEWRPTGDTAWKKAQDFVRVQEDRFGARPVPDPRMATMLFGLKEGAQYDYRVSFVGAGYPDKAFTGSFTTLTAAVPTGAGQVIPIVVSSKTTSADLMKALSAALSDSPDANAGKIIELRSAAGPGVPTVVRASLAGAQEKGEWHWSGTDKAWLTLRVAAGHDIVFDGSDPAYDVQNQGMWAPVDDAGLGLSAGDGVYVSRTSMPRPTVVYYERVPNTPGYRLLDITEGEHWSENYDGIGSSGVNLSRSAGIVSASRADGSTTVVVRTDRLPYFQNGDQITITGCPYDAWNGTKTVTTASRDDKSGVYEFRFQSSDDTSGRTVVGGTAAPVVPTSSLKTRAAAEGECMVWVPDAPGAAQGKVYVHLRNDLNPNTVRVKIPVISSCLDIGSAHNVRVAGLDIQYYGTTATGGFGGIGLVDVTDAVIEGNTLVGLNDFIGNRSGYNSMKERIIIKGNTFLERGLGADPSGGRAPAWAWIKMSKQENLGIFMNGRSISILDNTIDGMFNGVSYIGQGSQTYDGSQTQYPENYQTDGNTFIGIGDDAVEPEQWSVNYAVTDNAFRACYKGVSLAPLIGGPAYVLRNRWSGRGEYEGAGDWQSFLKMGNDDPGDTAYKLVANNSIVNINADASGEPLPGLMDSGATYNHFYYNNYVASDGFSIAYGYGSLGFPHIFDYNRYVEARPTAPRGSSSAAFGFGRLASEQGDNGNGSDHRAFATFTDWQTGKATQNANMPGYDGTVHASPVIAKTTGNNTNGPEQVLWMHDPHSTYLAGRQELSDPANGDFRPTPSAPLGGAGMQLPNITFDCGPAWSQFEEAGSPTIGAIPGGAKVVLGNRPPSVFIQPDALGSAKREVSLAASYSDPDGDEVRLIASVTDPAGAQVTSTIDDPGAGVATVKFTPAVEGIYQVVVLATDKNGSSASGKTTVDVLPEIPEGQEVSIQASVSRTDAKPGEPVIYTIACTNPTDHPVTDVVINVPVPAGMVFNTASATLNGQPVTASVAGGIFKAALGTVPAGVRQTLTVTAIIQ